MLKAQEGDPEAAAALEQLKLTRLLNCKLTLLLRLQPLLVPHSPAPTRTCFGVR